MTSQENDIQLSDDVEIIGPGQLLKEARLEQGLTEEQVAEQLHLRLLMVKNIEAEIFDPKIPETFMRGYLKNYAKLLSVNYQDIESSYEALDVAQRQENEMKSFSQTTKKKAENNLLMLAFYTFIVLLIAVTIVWWLQTSNNDKPYTEELDQQTTLGQSNNPQLDKELKVAISNQEKAVDIQSIDNNSSVEKQHTTPLDESIIEPVEQVQVSVEPSHSIVALDTQQLSDKELTQNKSTLVFSFSGDCWVNISDSTGERLAWGIKKADYIMTLQGTPPFTITLGQPQLVEISYNEQPIDMNQFQKGQIAKFSWPIR